MYDVIIIGAGPAGLTASIYLGIARKKVLILEKNTYGGQIIKTNKVKNYPGFEDITGFEYSKRLYDQAMLYNPEYKNEEVIEIKNSNECKEVITKENKYKAKSIIICTGAENRKLNIENEDKFIGKGLSYCATCDGVFYKNKTVAIYGGGNNAIEDAIYLSDLVSKLYFIHRKPELKIESVYLDELRKKDNVEFISDTVVEKLNGNDTLDSISIKNNSTGEVKFLDVDGLFVAIGHIPVSNMCNNLIETNNSGYIVALEDCKTKIDGIFCAGDVRIKDIRQLTTACADGTVAALAACKFLIR